MGRYLAEIRIDENVLKKNRIFKWMLIWSIRLAKFVTKIFGEFKLSL